MHLSLSGADSRAKNVADEVFIVEGDAVVREGWSLLFSQVGYRVTSFTDRSSFVAAARTRTPAGVVLSDPIPGGSGLDALDDIDAPRYGAPIFVAATEGDIPTAVEAIKRGAFDFVDKRTDAQVFVKRVCEAIAQHANAYRNLEYRKPLRSYPGSERLTSREREVLALIVSGASNKKAAEQLGISRRTVENHRAHILAKLDAQNAAHLVRMVLSSD